MRHRKKLNHLGRTSSHRKAMLANMASSLIMHKRISTTVAKAKALRVYVEPLITKSKTDSTHSRRMVFSYLKNKYAVSELFREVSLKVADRPGGYTRILKTGNRLGDNADMCIIELVDYNENMLAATREAKPAAKRRRRSRGKKSDEATEKTTSSGQKQPSDDRDVKPETIKQEKDPGAEGEKEAPAAAEKKEEAAPGDKPEKEAPAAAEKKEEAAPGDKPEKEAPAAGEKKEEAAPGDKPEKEAPAAAEKKEEAAPGDKPEKEAPAAGEKKEETAPGDKPEQDETPSDEDSAGGKKTE
jgi:large subunit ribosomal protein L17